MARFSGMDAAFEGFRITRNHPLAVLAWAVLTFVMAVASTFVMEALAGDALRNYMVVAESGAQPTPQETLAFFSAVGPVYLLMAALALPMNAIIINATTRAGATETSDPLAFLRVGARELTQAGNLLIWCLIMFGAYLGSLLVAVIPGTLLAVALGAVLQPLAAIVPVLMIVVVALAILLVSARFALAGPIAALEGRIGIGPSWTRTKGLSWPLVGALVIACVFALIVFILIGVVDLLVLSVVAGGWSGAWSFVSEGAAQQPVLGSVIGWVHTAFMSVASALTSVLVLGVGIGAYNQLTARSPTSVVETF